MATPDQSFSSLLRNIIADVQELIRTEIRFAKAELLEQANGLKSAAVLLGAGALTSLFGVFFALCSIALALSRVLPDWAAALIVGAALGVCGWLLLRIGRIRLQHLPFTPDRNDTTVKENS